MTFRALGYLISHIYDYQLDCRNSILIDYDIGMTFTANWCIYSVFSGWLIVRTKAKKEWKKIHCGDFFQSSFFKFRFDVYHNDHRQKLHINFQRFQREFAVFVWWKCFIFFFFSRLHVITSTKCIRFVH